MRHSKLSVSIKPLHDYLQGFKGELTSVDDISLDDKLKIHVVERTAVNEA